MKNLFRVKGAKIRGDRKEKDALCAVLWCMPLELVLTPSSGSRIFKMEVRQAGNSSNALRIAKAL